MLRKILIIVLLCLSLSIPAFSFIPAVLDSPIIIDNAPTGTTNFNTRTIARDSKGWVYAVYTGFYSGNRIKCSFSTDNGRTWSTFANYISGDAAYLPSIGVGRGDTLHVIWVSFAYPFDVWWSRYDGTSWIPPINVSKQYMRRGSGELYPSMVMDSSGRPHVCWRGYDSLITPGMFYSYYLGDTLWSTPENVTNSLHWWGSLGIDSQDNLHLTWQAGNIRYKKRTGGVWGQTEQVWNVRGWHPSIVCDSKNRPNVSWTDEMADVFHSLRDTSLSNGWLTPYNVSRNSWGSHFGNISIDRYDNLYLAWIDETIDSTRRGLDNIFYATYDGRNWSTPVALTTDTLWDISPNIGYPVTDSGVDLMWFKKISETEYRVMYWRLPTLPPSGIEKESEKLKVKSENLNLEIFPNPATSVANLRLQISDSRLKSFNLQSSNLSIFQSSISIKIYDVTGRLVREIPLTLKTDTDFMWDLSDDAGKRVSAGVYFVRLEIASPSSRNDRVDEKTQIKRVVVLR